MERDQSPTRKPVEPKDSATAMQLLRLLRENNGVLTPEQAKPFLSSRCTDQDVDLFENSKMIMRMKFPGKKGRGLIAPHLLPESKLPELPDEDPDIRILLRSGTYQTVVEWLCKMDDIDWVKQPLLVKRTSILDDIVLVHRSQRWGHLVFTDLDHPILEVYGKQVATKDLVYHLSQFWFPALRILCQRCHESYKAKHYIRNDEHCDCPRDRQNA